MGRMTDEELAKFFAERNSGLGGTDAATIVGVNPYRSPLDVYREKLGLTGEKPEMTEAMRLGQFMEPYLLERAKELIEDRTGGAQTVIPGRFYRHPEKDFLIGHLDGEIATADIGTDVDGIGIVECKTASVFMRSKWGDEWTDQIPEGYLIQTQHYIGVKDADYAYVAVLFGNSEFVVYYVARNDELIKTVFAMETDFWIDHIMKQEPPPIDGSDAASKLLKYLYPADSGEIMQATDEILPVINEYERVFRESRQIDKEVQLAVNLIQDHMKEASILEWDGGRISWKKSKDGEKTDYKKALGQALDNLPAESAEILKQALTDHTVPTVGSRRFLPPKEWYKEADESEE